jgi:flagellar protein FliS
MLANPLAEYKRTQVQTATPGQLVMMAYDAAVRYIESAEAATQANDLCTCNDYTKRAMSIIGELSISLDYSAGEIANNLYRLYEYMGFRLVQASLRKDPQIFREVAGLLQELRSGWERIPKI